jgi:5-dehydro-4-deoxyglucarate dehydratase
VPEYFAIGVQAYTSSISNIAPKVSLALAEAGMARDFPRLNALMAKYVHPLYALRERMKGYEVCVMKEAMEMMGMPAGPARPPLTQCRQQDIAEVRKIVAVYQASLEAGAA